MRIVTPKAIKQYAQAYPDAEPWLQQWMRKTRTAQWTCIQDVRSMYRHADAATVASGNAVTVFNVKGNKYRLIVSIKYQWAMVYVLRFLTHAQYSSNRWKDEL